VVTQFKCWGIAKLQEGNLAMFVNVLKARFLLLQAVKLIGWGNGMGRMRARVGVATGDVSVGMLLPETSNQLIGN
jgi:hypothetical protein